MYESDTLVATFKFSFEVEDRNHLIKHWIDFVPLSLFPSQIFVSKKWGFTKWDRPDYERMKADGILARDGCNVKYRPEHGPLATWKKVQEEIAGLA
jgi:hypothetical protein